MSDTGAWAFNHEILKFSFLAGFFSHFPAFHAESALSCMNLVKQASPVNIDCDHAVIVDEKGLY